MTEQEQPWRAVPMTDEEWHDRAGDVLNSDRATCSTCGALLHGGICLNACHLGTLGKHRFQNEMLGFVTRTKKGSPS